MAHLHNVFDSDNRFRIDPITRAITNESGKIKLVQHDHNSERFTFEVPRLVDGHDMSLCTKVEIHYLNVSASNSEQSADVYLVNDATVDEWDEDKVVFSWLISANATKYSGTLNFLVRFVCLDGETIEYAWNTAIFSDITIDNGMDNGEAVIAEYSDVLEAWKEEVLNGTDGIVTEIEAAKAEALNDIADAKETMLSEIELAAEIVQTTGNSETALMSQKAVTKAITPKSLQYAKVIPKETAHWVQFNTYERKATFKPFYILNGNVRYDIEEQTIEYSITETINVICYNPVTNNLYVCGRQAVVNENEWVLAVFNSNTIVSTGVLVCDCPYRINGVDYMPFNSNFQAQLEAKLESTATKLKVCSYNVGLYNNGVWVTGNPYDDYSDIVAAYRQFLNDGGLDLVGTQEDTDIKNSIYADVYDRQLPNHVYDDNMYANIRTVYPIISQETGMLTDGSRGYSSATISVNGKEIFVMSVHFGLDGDVQSANAAQVLEMVEGHEYAIVFGDFNAGNGDVSAESLFANFTNAGYKLALGDYLPFKSTVRNSEVKFYDNIITTPNIIIQNVRIGDGEGLYSDHLPVFAELLIV